MNRLATRIFTLLAVPLASLWAIEIPEDEVEGPFVRVKLNEDGSRTVFRRSPDNRTLTKRTYSPNGVLKMITVYRMDANGNPRGCKIFDGQEQELFKVGYGYDKTWGRLVEERMFDSRVKNIDPESGQEMPVRRFIYTYDAQGNRSKPIAIVLKPGARAEDVYHGPSALEKNPFDEAPADPANPRAKPVGGNRPAP
jgi:hypothetical protein